ncbi:multidrug resistance-associated protein 1 [Lepeophtheirus salmonis]|uniref:ABC-type glutathione-S-conjugate transporter n=1 Tax=Lepeophtheirus salmonis TaxID=72036 RepID=A0A0K2TNY2_LEPSM|nr:multidrug resistance-associated protein 1-like [Lepeophtheirus salmonis]
MEQLNQDEEANSTTMYLNGFCSDRDPFWDPDYAWNTNDPNFTSCFRKTILVWIPCLFFWAFLPFHIYKLYHSKARKVPLKTLGRVKALSCFILILIAFVDLGYWGSKEFYPKDLINPIIRAITFLAVFILLFVERARGYRISPLLTSFFLIYFATNTIDLYGHIRWVMMSGTTSLADITFFLHFFCIIVSFLCHFFVEPRPLYEDTAVNDIKSNNPCPLITSSFPSQISFSWLDSLLWTGFKRNLSFDDLWDLVPSLSSRTVVPIFLQRLDSALRRVKTNENGITYAKGDDNVEVKTKHEKKPQLSILPALARTFGPSILSAAVIKIVSDSLNFVPPLILKRIIKFSTNQEELWKGILYAVILFASSTVGSLVLSKFFYKMYVVGMKIKTSLISTIYRKALRVPTSTKKNISTGEIVNLMSVDAQKIVDLMPYINTVWSAPFQITIAIYLLWQTLGPSVLAGVLVMILLIPFNGFIASRTKTLQTNQMKEKDERIKLLNEVVQGIKIVKLYAWEQSFLDIISNVRSKEVKILTHIGYLQAGNSFIWTCAPFLVSLVTFATFILSSPENVLDSEKAFVCLTLFNILRFPLSMLPMIIGSMVLAGVSIKRINKFMNSEEIDEEAVEKKTAYPDDKFAINLEKACLKWESDEDKNILSDVSLDIEVGSLVAVVGTVGSGKSSLLSAILGEMDKVSGLITVRGSIAYGAQQAWVLNTSLKNNILFNKSYDGDKYTRIVEACALKSDLDMLPGGDETEIGEKGINLSGGQKQRVSLARAVYSGSDIYLLDDPLSAVDSHVGKHIYDNVISSSSGILKDKTRVMVTHGVTYLPFTDKIIVMKDGRVSEIGTYKELLRQKGAFAEFIVQFLSEANENEVNENIKHDIEESFGKNELLEQITKAKQIVRERSVSLNSGDLVTSLVKNNPTNSASGSTTSLKENSGDESTDNDTKQTRPTTSQTQQYQDEKVETGSVKWNIYMHYVKNMSIILVVACSSCFVIYQALNTLSNVLLAWWSDAVMKIEVRTGLNDNRTLDEINQDIMDTQVYYLSIYGGYCLGQGIVVVMGFVFMYLACMEAAQRLHNQMLESILKSPMSFFDTTPQGRILNRLGKDLDVLDSVMPMVLRGWISCFLGVLSSLIVVMVTTPVFIIPASLIIICYFFIQRIYVATSRQLKRLESSSRSPIYSFFSETVSGAATIRAYGQSSTFISESESKVDDNQKANFPATVSNRWLAVRLEVVGNLIVFTAALLAVLGRDSLSPGLVGLSVSYALAVTASLNWLVRMASEVETNIVAVERIQEYTKAEKEAPWIIEDTKPDEDWPRKGEISFKNYSTRYREGLDYVLKNVSLDIEGGEKIGIVGRTGAGKSSFTLSMFRIIEPVTGNIIIDGVDITKLGLHQLRSRITIIPQDPVLFSGSLRRNLDPLDEYNETNIMEAISHSHLKPFIDSLKDGLEYHVSEGGENLSLGQRQLICLARALLRRTRVLILDEATAAVDLETDNLIQKTIRSEFKDSTVITIAHRLNTIMDYSKILVLKNGERVEYGTVAELLADKKSQFYSMCSDAGLV